MEYIEDNSKCKTADIHHDKTANSFMLISETDWGVGGVVLPMIQLWVVVVYCPNSDVQYRACSIGKYNTPNKDAYIYLKHGFVFFYSVQLNHTPPFFSFGYYTT